jgi:hypothetical protein
VVQRGWERDMPKGSALRAGVAAALLCGLLGFAVNDSGTVVTALVFVYLGPFITLLALDRGRHRNLSGLGESSMFSGVLPNSVDARSAPEGSVLAGSAMSSSARSGSARSSSGGRHGGGSA